VIVISSPTDLSAELRGLVKIRGFRFTIGGGAAAPVYSIAAAAAAPET
jgi:hypothetical protein